MKVDIPAVVAYGDSAICGSHRIAAYNDAIEYWENDEDGWQSVEKPELEVIYISDAEFEAASKLGEVDSLFDHPDYNDICAWVFEVTTDTDVKAALADQVP